MHLDLDDAVALARFAATALYVEAESSGCITTRLGFRQAREPITDRAEGAGIGGRVRTRCAADRALVNVDDLVEVLQPVKAFIGLGWAGGAIQLAGQRLVECFDDERRLAAAGYAGDAGEAAKWDSGGDILQIVPGCAFQRNLALCLFDRAARRDRDFLCAVQIISRQTLLVCHDFIRRTLSNDLPAMHTRRWAHVDDMVSGENGVLIMLHNDHGVSKITQAFQCFQQAIIVALMQANARLIQNIEHAGQAGANLAGEADALAFTAGQRARSAAERQVFEADIIEEVEPVIDLFQDTPGNFILLLGQRLVDRCEPFMCLFDGKDRRVRNVETVDLYRQRFGLQAFAATSRAGCSCLEFRDLVAHPLAVGFAIAAFKVWNDALERFLHLIAAHAIIIDEVDLFLACSEQDHLVDVIRQFVPGLLEVKPVVRRQGLQRLRLVG